MCYGYAIIQCNIKIELGAIKTKVIKVKYRMR